jgi:hypothetical protein
VQKVRSDRGGEYVNEVLEDFAARKGIVLELTAGYSPESNRAAERLNRTLIEHARAMLLDASLSLSLWGEVVVAACHVWNRSPTAGTRAGTPWVLFFGSVPDVSHLRVLGCKVFCRVPRVLRGKLDSVSYSGVFVGYSGGGHRVLVDGTNSCLLATVVGAIVCLSMAQTKSRCAEMSFSWRSRPVELSFVLMCLHLNEKVQSLV